MTYICERCMRVLAPQQVERFMGMPFHRIIYQNGPDELHPVHAAATDGPSGHWTSSMADDHDVTASRDSLGGQPTADTPPRPSVRRWARKIEGKCFATLTCGHQRWLPIDWHGGALDCQECSDERP